AYNQMLVAPLIHVAIHGVQASQPLRWAGHPFESFELFHELEQQFITRGLLAAMLAVIALLLIYGIVTLWKWHWTIRAGLLVAWVICIGAIASLIHWSYESALPVL